MNQKQPPSLDRSWRNPDLRRAYIVCATPRSGSNLLCRALWNSGEAGRPDEHFLPWVQAPEAQAVSPADHLYATLVKGTGDNGVFGTKIMWSHVRAVVLNLRQVLGDASSPPYRLLAQVFPRLQYLRTTRRDKIRQAVSLAKAVRTGLWYENDEPRAIPNRSAATAVAALADAERTPDAPVPSALQYDFAFIGTFYHRLIGQERAWSAYFAEAGVDPLTVAYEDLARDQLAAGRAALAFLGLRSGKAQVVRSMRRQSDAVNDEWAARFAEDLEQAAQSPGASRAVRGGGAPDSPP